MAEINTQRSTMSRQKLDVKYFEFVLVRKTLNRHKRKVREMLVIDRVELVPVNEPLKMGELERDHTIWGQHMHHSCGKIIEISDLRRNIVTNNEIGLHTLRHELLCEF